MAPSPPEPVAVLGGDAWFPPRGPRWILPAPDGASLLVGGLERQVVRMDASTGAMRELLSTHGRGVLLAALHPEGTRLFFSDFDRHLVALDLVRGDELWRVPTPHRGSIEHLRITGDGRHLVSGDQLRTVFLWTTASGRRAGAGHELPGNLHGLATAPTGRALAALHAWPEAPGLQVWDRVGPRLLLEVSDLGELAGEQALAFSHGGQRAWVGTATEPRLRAFDLGGGGSPAVTVEIEGPVAREIEHHPQALALSPDGGRLAALTRREFLVLDPDDGALVARWNWHEAGLPEGETLARLLAWSPDGRTLWTRGYSERIWGWPAAGGGPLHPYTGHRRGVERIALSRDGRRLHVATLDSRVHPWDVDAGTPGEGRSAPPWPAELTRESRFVQAPDGSWKARARADRVDLVPASDARDPGSLEWPGLEPRSPLAFLPNGRLLVAQDPGGVLVFWNLATGVRVLTYEVPALAALEGPGGPLRVSPGGDLLATRGREGRVVLLELHHHHPREPDEALRVTRTWELPLCDGPASLLTFSGDGRRLGVGTWSRREVRVYEVAALLAAEPMG